jgi:hypothetical protein
MRRLRRPALALLALWTLTPTLAHGQAVRAGIVTTLEGAVTVSRGPAPQPAALRFKDDVFVQDRVTTGDRALARMLLGGKALVTVRERSSLTISEVPGQSTVALDSGKIGLSVARAQMRPGESIQVRTPNAIAGVRGTVLVAEVVRAGAQLGGGAGIAATLFHVLRGVVEIVMLDPVTGQPRGAPRTVNAGESARVTDAGVSIGPSPPVGEVTAGLSPRGFVHSEPVNQPQLTLQSVQTTQALMAALVGEATGQPLGEEIGELLPSPSGMLNTGEAEASLLGPGNEQTVPSGDAIVADALVTPALPPPPIGSTAPARQTFTSGIVPTTAGQPFMQFTGTVTDTDTTTFATLTQATLAQAGTDNAVQADPGSLTSINAPLMSVTDGVVQTNVLLDVQGDFTSLTTLPLISLDPTVAETTSAFARVSGAGARLTLSGTLFQDVGGDLTAFTNFLEVSAGGVLTDSFTAVFPVLSLNQSTLVVGSLAGHTHLITVNGAGSRLTNRGPVLSASLSDITVNGFALLEVFDAALLEQLAPGHPVIDLVGGTLTLGAGVTAVLVENATLDSVGPVVRVNGTDLTLSPDSSFARYHAGSGDIAGLLHVADALFQASQPIVLMAAGSSVDSTADFLRFTANAQLQGTFSVGSAAVVLDASTLRLLAGALLSVAGAGTSATITGDLLRLANGSTLQILNDALARVAGGASLTITGALGRFGAGTNTLDLSGAPLCNGACVPLLATGFSILLLNGANVTIDPAFDPFPGLGGTNTVVIANGRALLVVDGAASTLVLGDLSGLPGLTIGVGDTFDFSTGLPQTFDTLVQTGGLLTGSDTVTFLDQATWSGGTMSGTGTTVFQADAALTGAAGKGLDGRVLNTVGTTTWSGGAVNTGNGAVINNSGTWDLTFDGIVSNAFGGAVSTFNNLAGGTFRKSGGAGTATLAQGPFDNAGLVDVQSGRLRLAGGGTSGGVFTVQPGAVLEFGGGTHTLTGASSVSGPTVEFGGGTANVQGAYDVTGTTTVSGATANFTGTVLGVGTALAVSSGTANFSSGEAIGPTTLALSGGTLTGSDAITVSGLTTWTAGTQSGAGTTTFQGDAALSGTAGKGLNGRGLNTAGTTTWSGGPINTGTGAVITNSGTWDLTFDGLMSNGFGGGLSTFSNLAGATFRKSGGAGTATLQQGPFDNAGTVEVQSGTLSLNGGGTHTGPFTIAAGAALRLGAGSHSVTSSSTVTGAGTLRVAGGTVDVFENVFVATEVTGGTLQSSGRFSVVASPMSAVALGASLLSRTTAGTLAIDGNVLEITESFATLTSTAAVPLIGLTGGNHSLSESGVAMLTLGSLNDATETTDPESGLDLGDQTPLTHGDTFVRASGGSLATSRVLAVDTVLLQASKPIIDLLAAHTMTTAGSPIAVNSQGHLRANLVPGDAVVMLNAATLNITSGSLMEVTNQSAARIVGHLASLTGGSTLNILAGGFLTVTNGSVFHLTGGSLASFGTGTNAINITNAAALCGGCAFAGSTDIANFNTTAFPVLLRNGALASNVTVTAGFVPFANLGGTNTLNLSGASAAVLVLDGATSKIKLGP